MSRPEHLHCPNSAAGISRINEEQARYDEDEDAYEAEQLARDEQHAMEVEYEAECQAREADEAMAEQEAMEAECQQCN